MKKTYEQPQIEVVSLESTDIVASGDPNFGFEGESGFDWDE